MFAFVMFAHLCTENLAQREARIKAMSCSNDVGREASGNGAGDGALPQAGGTILVDWDRSCGHRGDPQLPWCCHIEIHEIVYCFTFYCTERKLNLKVLALVPPQLGGHRTWRLALFTMFLRKEVFALRHPVGLHTYEHRR